MWKNVLLILTVCFSLAEHHSSTGDDYEYVSNPIKDLTNSCTPGSMGEYLLVFVILLSNAILLLLSHASIATQCKIHFLRIS